MIYMVVNLFTAGLKIIGTTTTGKQKQEEKGDNKYAICTIVNSDIFSKIVSRDPISKTHFE